MARKTVFITGTDTEVGKTMVSAALLYAAARAGYRTLALKPVAAGCEETAEGLRNDDALMLQAAMTEQLSYSQVNPVALAEAIAPHVAAVNAGVRLSVQRLAGFCRGVMLKPADFLLIEGAGGWRVPLNERESYAGLPVELACQVILVVDLRLGAINHALLTAEAIRRDGLQLIGWVANRASPLPMQAEAQTLAFLAQALGAPLLAELPHQTQSDPRALAQYIDDQVMRDLIEN
ncbi:dethiobiotin synthase [Hydrocarboniclastica marina]|uniref:ATP-dependent dethiobiotin synthetase BioD n=1 Tax=Hydrocarboniclastica marina TaxID=2259620 RepID=A0A4P7XIP6_9ALTE|nr:dethiobiotin synthase [Hydrocarboniclastica marina]MAL97503.1 dethiobiotin synthase [Alteromonadaceae bacterium]QCF26603.1 dethiobiotin synthase [Hydrocarboniclastica marina]